MGFLIRRGLSKFYQGKSESFTCLSWLTSIDDLAKEERLHIEENTREVRDLKVAWMPTKRSLTLPKPLISKKISRDSFSSSFSNRRGSFINGSSRPPQIPLAKCLDGGMWIFFFLDRNEYNFEFLVWIKRIKLVRLKGY